MAITEDLVSSAVILLCGVCEKQLQEEGKATSTGHSSDQYWLILVTSTASIGEQYWSQNASLLELGIEGYK